MKNYDLIYFMGDSFTLGLGQLDDTHKEINLTNRFSNLIGKNYNLPVINNAVAGCSNYFIFSEVYKDIYHLIKQNKKILAVISYTSPVRQELWSVNKNSPVTISPNFSFYKEFMLESFNTDYCDNLTKSYILSIRTLFHRFNIDYVDAFTSRPILTINYIDNSKCLNKSFDDILQDEDRFVVNGHANVNGNKKIAEEFIKKIDFLYGTS